MRDYNDENTVTVYTDGSCYPNPDGRGGWAFYCMWNGIPHIRHGFAEVATNNRMELEAIMHALLFVPLVGNLSRGAPLVVYTDSQYAKRALTEWVPSWEARGWVTASGDEVKNRDLITKTYSLVEAHRKVRAFDLRWVKGHAGNPENELVDTWAGIGRRDQSTNWAASDNHNADEFPQ